MEQTNIEKTATKKRPELDLRRLFYSIWRRAWIVALSTLLCVAIFVLATVYLITPKYQAKASFYVNNNAISVQGASVSLSSGDITAAKSLVDTYIVFLQSRTCLEKVLVEAESDLEVEELSKMIHATAINETEVFEVVVTSDDPIEARDIADAIATVLPQVIQTHISSATSAKNVDRPIVPEKPSSPSYVRNALLGFILGFFGSVAVLATREIFDTTIRTEDDIAHCCKYPILASVPDMNFSGKGGYYYGGKYAKAKRYQYAATAKKPPVPETGRKTQFIGKNISFSAFEAYKLLRTKLQFSFVDDVTCPVIGISSALAGEGKSLSAVNLAYAFSQLEKRVLLIDCDLRRPSLNVKLPVKKNPGLSDYLTGNATLEESSQFCKVDEEGGFAVISSGRTPPNPIELLSSSKMENLIKHLRGYFDYIILDLPPVDEVSDAMVAARFADGILLVVREDYCNITALAGAVGQFDFIESRILGLVVNCVIEGGFGSRYYGKKYYGYGKYRKNKYQYAASSLRDSAKSAQALEKKTEKK